MSSGACETRTRHLDTASVKKYTEYQSVIFVWVTIMGNVFKYEFN